TPAPRHTQARKRTANATQPPIESNVARRTSEVRSTSAAPKRTSRATKLAARIIGADVRGRVRPPSWAAGIRLWVIPGVLRGCYEDVQDVEQPAQATRRAGPARGRAEQGVGCLHGDVEGRRGGAGDAEPRSRGRVRPSDPRRSDEGRAGRAGERHEVQAPR